MVLNLLVLLVPNLVRAVDYTQDANCQGAFLMEDGLSANSDDETDEAKGNTLTETGGDIPNDADKKFGDWSRDFERDDSEYLAHANGLDTDINGADQPISIVYFIKREADSSRAEYIVAKYQTGGNNRQYGSLIQGDQSGDPHTFILSNDGSSTVLCTGATEMVAGTWFHFAVVYNDTDIRIYIDGSLDSNGASNPKTYSSGIANKGHEFRIGDRDSGATQTDYKADGLIDDVGVFDDELSSTEVNDIMDNGLQPAVVAAVLQPIINIF